MLKLNRRPCCLNRVRWMVLFISLDVLAAGGAGNQGVLLAGQGLDWQRSGTQLQPVPVRTAIDFPPPAKSRFSIGAADIEIESCSSISKRHATCRARVWNNNKNAPSSLFCGQWLSNQADAKQVYLYALNAGHDGRGRFEFQSPGAPPRNVILACGVKNPSKIEGDEWATLGAVGKCMLWPFPNPNPPTGPSCVPPPPEGFPPTDTDSTNFDTCIRAVRADYCGLGVSYTKDNTVVDLYAVKDWWSHPTRPAFLLEANWDQTGALCVLHARYLSLSPECQNTFPILVSLLGEREGKGVSTGGGVPGSAYHCKPSKKYEEALRGALKRRPDKCDPTGECTKLKVARESLLLDGVLMDDSLLQP
jgi:hypothetical protein